MNRAFPALTLLPAMVLGIACSSTPPGLSEEAAVTAAEDFLADMEVGAWNAAYSRMHEDLQAECDSAERLQELVESAGQRPESWTLREPKVRPSQALVSGEVVPQGGGQGIVELTLIPADDAWKIRFWAASNRELCGEGSA